LLSSMDWMHALENDMERTYQPAVCCAQYF